jgi:hypothetical protein
VSSIDNFSNDLDSIERSKFEDGERQSSSDIIATMSYPRSVSMIFTEQGKLKGYLSARSADGVTANNLEFDHSKRNLYVESVAGSVDPFKTLAFLKEQAKKTGYTKISMHGINPRLNKILKRFGFETKEIIPNWLGKTAEYMEMGVGLGD